MRFFQQSSLIGLFIGLATLCSAAPLYQVDINTTGYAGSVGAIYFQFDSGLDADPATVWITTFAIAPPGALSGTPDSSIGVTGALDALPLVIPNSEAWNYYLHYLTFGDWISFRVTFDLPDPLTGSSGSLFSFGLTAADGISPILTDDPSGFIGQIGYNELGVFSITRLSEAGTVGEVPEPGTLALLAIGFGACALGVRFRRAA